MNVIRLSVGNNAFEAETDNYAGIAFCTSSGKSVAEGMVRNSSAAATATAAFAIKTTGYPNRTMQLPVTTAVPAWQSAPLTFCIAEAVLRSCSGILSIRRQ